MVRRVIKGVIISLFTLEMWWPLSFLPIPSMVDWFPFGPVDYDGKELFNPYSTKYYFFFLALYLNILVFSYIIYILCKKFVPALKTFSLILFLFSILRVLIFVLYSYGAIWMYSLTVGIFVYSLFILRKRGNNIDR